jgi:glycogenin glucosyltransferase
MKQSYVSLLATNDYLDGLLVLFYSLKQAKSKFDLCVLVTPDISLRTCSVLTAHSIAYTVIDCIKNPSDIHSGHRWFRSYSKLHVFGLTQYDKIVYLDADMLVLQNIDELFERPHMSAANAGGMLPHKADWLNMNSGLFVAVPSAWLVNDMLSQVGKIEVLASGGTPQKPRFGSDQDFVNAYYRDWTQRTDLHLDHKYNMLHYHLDAYSRCFGYTLTPGAKRVAVIHYGSYLKPWTLGRDVIDKLQCGTELSLENCALQLWIDARGRISP